MKRKWVEDLKSFNFYLFIYWCIYLFINLFIYLFIYLSIYLFIYQFIYLFIYSFIFCHFLKPLKFVWGLPKWTIFTGKKHISCQEKIGKSDFAPQENIPLMSLHVQHFPREPLKWNFVTMIHVNKNKKYE